MSTISVDQFAMLSPAVLRLEESKFVLERFMEASTAPHNNTLFLLTTYFDAFLFCYASIEEMVNDPQLKRTIQDIPVFMFFKALRNIATHHSVLSGVEGKFPRPITRIVKIGVPENAVFCILPDKIEFIFSEIVRIRPRERKTIEAAQAFLDTLAEREGDILVHELMNSAIESVEPYLA